MAVSSSCCLNLNSLPSISKPSSQPTKATQIQWPTNERSWRSKCVLGAACMIIGLTGSASIGNEQKAVAGDMLPLAVEYFKEKAQTQRWSDKRTCSPWRFNSLENIVPENLPRPSTRRRWEAVGHSSEAAPAVKVAAETSTDCFSM